MNCAHHIHISQIFNKYKATLYKIYFVININGVGFCWLQYAYTCFGCSREFICCHFMFQFIYTEIFNILFIYEYIRVYFVFRMIQSGKCTIEQGIYSSHGAGNEVSEHRQQVLCFARTHVLVSFAKCLHAVVAASNLGYTGVNKICICAFFHEDFLKRKSWWLCYIYLLKILWLDKPHLMYNISHSQIYI